MRTVYHETRTDESTLAVRRDRQRKPGDKYQITCGTGIVELDFNNLSDDALLAVLLDRAEIADAREESAATAERVTAIKKIKSGNDGRGRAASKRGKGASKTKTKAADGG